MSGLATKQTSVPFEDARSATVYSGLTDLIQGAIDEMENGLAKIISEMQAETSHLVSIEAKKVTKMKWSKTGWRVEM